MDNEKIGRLIGEKRKEKKMTQSELAEILYVSNKTVSKWERGLGFPSIEILLPLSKTLDIRLEELLGEDTKKSYDELLVEEVRYHKKRRILEMSLGIVLCLFLCFLEIILYWGGVSSYVAAVILGAFLVILIIVDIFIYFIYRK